MKDQDIILAIEELISGLGIELRYEKGDFEGGLCRVDQDRLIIVNTNLSLRRKIRLLARELGRLDLDDVFIVPALRRLIEREKKPEETNDLSGNVEVTKHD